MQRQPVGKVELSFACHHLTKLDTFSKSDPYIIVKLREENGPEPWKQILKTETIRDNQNPKFKSTVIVDYYFERVQLLRFEVWDDDTHKPDFQGEFECKLGEIVGARGQLITAVLKDVKHSHRKGSITIYAEEVYTPPQFTFQAQSTIPPPSADLLTEIAQLQQQLQVTPPTITAVAQHFRAKCSGKHLDKKDLFGKSDPYFKIFRIREQESILVFESEVIMKTLDPEWKPIDIDLQKLCNNDPQRPLRFEVYDWDKHSEHDLIGVFETSVHQILTERKEYPLIHTVKREKKGKDYKDSGIFHFENPSLTGVENLSAPNPAYAEMSQRLNRALAVKAKYDQEYAEQYRYKYQVVQNQNSFLQYLAGGCEISLMVAIDFTGSNGHPLDQISLHYIGGHKPNEYQQAIQAVGNILADYDYDKIFPVWGFGGKYKGSTNHCFPLREPDGNCQGVEGILATYAEAIRKYDLSGPTYFHEVIAAARRVASANTTQQNQKYFILLIITDGVIESIQKTISEIIQAANLPLSIVIVGVGDADFGSMDALDADGKPLQSKIDGRDVWASRDIVQFVPFSKYKHNPQKLAEETLAEIPRQLVSFMGLNRIVPNPKVVVQPQVPIPPQQQ